MIDATSDRDIKMDDIVISRRYGWIGRVIVARRRPDGIRVRWFAQTGYDFVGTYYADDAFVFRVPVLPSVPTREKKERKELGEQRLLSFAVYPHGNSIEQLTIRWGDVWFII